MLRIGEFSKLSGLSADTLYHYEKLKILVPVSVDDSTGYRSYDSVQLLMVNKIMALKDAGFSLEEITGILHEDLSPAVLIEKLEEKARRLEGHLSGENQRLERLHTNIFLIKNGGIPQMNDITIKKVEPVLIASMRKTFDKSGFDENLSHMWPNVNRSIDKKGVKRTIPCLMLYHSGWWDEKQLNMNYDEKVLYTLPPVDKMASIVHKGPFSTIPKTFEMLFDWMKHNHYVAAGPAREIYHKGDWATGDPDEYITELQVPNK
jgi:DNA-binding transcriptional MerR regulator